MLKAYVILEDHEHIKGNIYAVGKDGLIEDYMISSNRYNYFSLGNQDLFLRQCCLS